MNSTVSPAPAGKKQRPCPVLNGPISAADCGAQRGRRLPCPASCPFFPFAPAGFELWSRVEAEWSRKALDRVIRVHGRQRLQACLKAEELPLEPESTRVTVALGRALHRLLFREPGPDGRTVAAAWEAAGWAGLNNDEQVMMRHQRDTRLAVLEVQRVADARSLVCTDLLDPARPPFLVMDRELAPSVVRFTRLLTGLTHFPHFATPSLPTVEVSHALWAGWWDWVRTQAATAAGVPAADVSAEAVRGYLEAHLGESLAQLKQLEREHRVELLEELGLYQCLARFQLEVPLAEFEAVLHQHPALRPAALPPLLQLGAPRAAFTWTAGPEETPAPASAEAAPPAEPATPPALGFFRLYPDSLVVETTSRARHARAVEWVNREFPTQTRFLDDVQLDLTRAYQAAHQRQALVHAAENAIFGELEHVAPEEQPALPNPTPGETASPTAGEPAPPESAPAAAESAPDAASLPPTPEQLQAEHDARYRRLLDLALPELGGLTPRQAVADPARRPAVVSLFKTHLHNLERRNRREPVPLSLDWVLDELGLAELK
jgi:hypothetical protein